MRTSASRWVLGAESDVLYERDAQVIFAAHAILVMGTVLVSPLIADLARVFAVSEARAGLFIIAYTGTFLVALPVAGVVADRVGRKTTIVPGLVLFGIAGAAISLVDGFWAAIALRILQAIGVAFAQPVLVALLGDLYHGARETTAQGVRVALDSALSIVSPFLAGILFVVSWRYPFLAYLVAVPVAIWLWYVLPDIETGDGRTLGSYLRDLAGFVGNRLVGLLLASFFVRHLLLYGVYTYISVLAITEVGVDVVVVGLLLSLLSFLKLASSTQVGRLVTHLDTALVVLTGFAMGGLGILAMGLVPTLGMLVVGMALVGLGDGLISPTQKSLVNQLSPPAYRSSSMSVALTATNLGRSLGPLGLGIVLVTIGPAPMFVLLGLIGGGTGVALLAGIWLLREDR